MSGIGKEFNCKKENGKFPAPGDCESFYQCSNGIPHLMPCPNGLLYDPRKKLCNFPDQLTDRRQKRCNVRPDQINSVGDEIVTTAEPIQTTEEPNNTTDTKTTKICHVIHKKFVLTLIYMVVEFYAIFY